MVGQGRKYISIFQQCTGRSVIAWCWRVLFGGLLLPSYCLAAGQVIELSEAGFIVSAGDRPPSSAAWQPVQLTHRWTAREYALGRNGWYRLVLNLPQAPAQHWVIYLRRFNMNAALFLNGQFLTDGGRFDEPLSRNWNRPLYASVPSSLRRNGENVIHIRLKSYAGHGYLAPVFIGPTALLDGDFARQKLLQIEISKALFPITLAIGLFVLGLWIRRERSGEGDKRLRQLRAHLDDGLCEMRNLILTLEEDLSTLGELLNHLNDKYSHVLASLDIDYHADIRLCNEARSLTQKQSLNLLRILQEALNNIVQHAHATEVFLQVSEDAGKILIELRDNGCGFDTRRQSSGHYGLGNMRKRSDEIGAGLVVRSTPGGGTVVQLTLSVN